jgi:5-methylcytosine-specific restriction enzyme A
LGDPMPGPITRPCAHPGCPKLITEGSYCPEHRKARKRTQKREQRARPGFDDSFYGSANWKKIRRMVLARQPLCADPYGVHEAEGRAVPATEVDHIVPIAAGGPPRSLDNLQSLCKRCHSQKTAGEVFHKAAGR